jgi:hypothetical protein
MGPSMSCHPTKSSVAEEEKEAALAKFLYNGEEANFIKAL